MDNLVSKIKKQKNKTKKNSEIYLEESGAYNIVGFFFFTLSLSLSFALALSKLFFLPRSSLEFWPKPLPTRLSLSLSLSLIHSLSHLAGRPPLPATFGNSFPASRRNIQRRAPPTLIGSASTGKVTVNNNDTQKKRKQLLVLVLDLNTWVMTNSWFLCINMRNPWRFHFVEAGRAPMSPFWFLNFYGFLDMCKNHGNLNETWNALFLFLGFQRNYGIELFFWW